MPRPTRTPWTAEELEAQLPRHRLGDLADPARHLSWLEAIARLGVAVVTDIPPTVDGLRSVAGRIGIIESTNYGVEWDIVTTDDPFNQVDSDLPLRVHSDLPYRRQPPGMQILLAAETGAAGGETILVDGHRLAERIRTEDPAAWATLTTVSRAFSYVRPDQRYIGGGPVIGLGDDGEVDVIRHAPDLVLPCRDGDEREADRALSVFVAMAAADDLAFRHRLDVGEALVFDNHRVLHGREPVDLRSGGRRLLGCYLAADEFDSALRVARRAVSA